ncbi:MAG: vWA domain-containing protein [Bacteroidota bacterium]
MQNISFAFPAWYLLLCALAGLGVALLLYYRSNTFAEQPSWRSLLMGILRWLGFSLIAALLLSPLLRYLQTDEQEPVVVLLQDVSESVGLSTDTTTYRQLFSDFRRSISQDYRVVSYTFADRIEESEDLTFDQKRTNLSEALDEISDLYANQNVGAVILATDGIYNEGANPVYRPIQLQAPIYTIGLGDTTRRRDLLIKQVYHNRIAYLNDAFSIQIDLAARNAAGSRTRLSVSRVGETGRQELHTENIEIDDNDFFNTREVIIEADRAGVQRYRISLSGIGDEVSTSNNSRDIFVDVLDARQKILLLASAPHPDLSAMKQALLGGNNNEVEVVYAEAFDGTATDYDLVVLHQLPNARFPLNGLIGQANQAAQPIWFVAGANSDYNILGRSQSLLSVSPNVNTANEVSPLVSTDFSLFNISDELRRSLSQFPPVETAFGEFQAGPGANTLLRQRIGRVDTEYPLLVVGEEQGARRAVLAGTGIWRWRLFDYLENEDHLRFDELISQVTQYLSVTDDKRRFRVNQPTNLFDENEPITFDAELYNANYELVNEPDVTITVSRTGEGGSDYNYTFSRVGNAYRLDAGILPAGNYRYRAEVNTGTEALDYNGQFSIRPVEVERYALEADHGMLRLLSERYGGDFLLPNALPELPQQLEARGTVKPVQYSTVTTRSVVNLKWIFFLLLGILTGEWVLRRYFGAY